MTYYSGCDVHRGYSVFVGIDEEGVIHGPNEVGHDNGELESHLRSIPENSPVAIETSGHWYWIADRIEEMGHRPRLTNASRASRMMGTVDKTDSLDAQGLAMLQKTGTLPEIWIPRSALRDKREMLRFRMKLVQSKTRWKNRSQALLMKHGKSVSLSDAFGPGGRREIESLMEELPVHARRVLDEQLEMMDQFRERIRDVEEALDGILEDSRERRLLQTIPGIGSVLSAMLVLEIGDVQRFPGPGHLASYAGVVPGIHASGGKRTDTGLRTRCHQTLKWGYMEAANAVVRQKNNYTESRLIQKYRRLEENKPSGVAKGAVARMLAESTYWVLTKDEPYEEPDGWSPE